MPFTEVEIESHPLIVAVPYHADAPQALRLLKWLSWLSSQNGNSLKKSSVLLLPSRHASQRSITEEICALAANTFGEARCYVPDYEYEKGWPGSCNFMMKEALEHVEQYFQDDMLLLEPDATPLSAGWLESIQFDWEKCCAGSGKYFMGAYVAKDIPHMSGIGVYGRGWRDVAPKLAEVQDVRGWDTFAADQMVPHTHFTELIQHVQWATTGHRSYEGLSLNPGDDENQIHPKAVIFHQDKSARVMKLCDDKFWQGRADAAIGYSKPFKDARVDMRYFFNHNQNREIRRQGIEIIFDYYDNLAGTSRGILATDDEAKIIALADLASDGSTGIIELSPEDYAERTKKKVMPRSFSPDLVIPQRQERKSQIIQSPAVLVAEPDKSPVLSAPDGTVTGPVVDDIEKVIKIGRVKLPEHVQATITKQKGRRKGAQ